MINEVLWTLQQTGCIEKACNAVVASVLCKASKDCSATNNRCDNTEDYIDAEVVDTKESPNKSLLEQLIKG